MEVIRMVMMYVLVIHLDKATSGNNIFFLRRLISANSTVNAVTSNFNISELVALWPLDCNHMGRDVSGAPDLSMTYDALALTSPVITCSEDTRQQFNISGSANFAGNAGSPVFLEVFI